MAAVTVTLGNNSTIELNETEKNSPLKIFAPSLGSGDVHENTNSDFLKINKIVDYNWEKIEGANLIAVHRAEPLIAYIINVGHAKNIAQGKTGLTADSKMQVIKLLNYEKQTRGIQKDEFQDTVTDIAFSSGSHPNSKNKLAIVDRSANVYLYEYYLLPENSLEKAGFKFRKIAIIASPTGWPRSGLNNVKLAWCPYIPPEEPTEFDSMMKFAVVANNSSTINKVEVFYFDRFAELTDQKLTRDSFNRESGEFYTIADDRASAITSVALSNDGSAICAAFADNVICFYTLGEETKVLKTWSPDLGPNESISHFCFLDDYDFLLANPEYHFWGYVFTGTSKGCIGIWDLRSPKWACIQRLSIDTEFEGSGDSSSAGFTYRVDTTAHVILAIKNLTAFVLLVEFVEKKLANQANSSPDSSEDSRDEEILEPRIRQVARFQLYNPVISFAVKRSSDKEIDLFWVTQKSLERCTIDLDNLDEVKAVSRDNRRASISVAASAPSSAVKTPRGPSVPAGPTPPNPSALASIFSNFKLSTPTSTPDKGPTSTASATKPVPSPVSTPSAFRVAQKNPRIGTGRVDPKLKEEELLSRVAATSNELAKLKRQSDPKIVAGSPGALNISSTKSDAQGGNSISYQDLSGVFDKLAMSTPQSTPTKALAPVVVAQQQVVPQPRSPQVAQIPVVPQPPTSVWAFNQQQQQIAHQQQQIAQQQQQIAQQQQPLVPQQMPPLGPPIGYPMGPQGFAMPMAMAHPQMVGQQMVAMQANNNAALEGRLNHFEQKLEDNLRVFSAGVTAAVSGLQADVMTLKINREDLLTRDQRLTEQVIDKVVNKSMSSLNKIVTDGLKEFFVQMKGEVDELQVATRKAAVEIENRYSEVNAHLEEMGQKMQIFQKQLEKNEAEQQLLLYRFQQTVAMNVAGAGFHM